MSIVINSISIYPIKSTRGHALQHARVQARGLENDRRWMLVDHDGKFITARKHSKLLGVSEASLADLDVRTPIDVTMSRFRPNVSIAGAYIEDDWRRIKLGDVEFEIPKRM